MKTVWVLESFEFHLATWSTFKDLLPAFADRIKSSLKFKSFESKMDVNKFSEKIQQEEHFQWELSIEIGKLDVQTS